tara:strand:- start:677 stop:1111 length:435 start_codon:yes stop_codon:yes gene_type:complete
MKRVLFVCTGNSARSIIAESIINNLYYDKFIGYSAGSNPSEQINPIIEKFLKEKKFDLSNYSSKNFDTFINSDIKLDYVITVCNNANNEVCPIWPDKNQIIHWDIEDPVKKFNEDNDATNQKKIFNDTYQTIFKKIENWINNEI